MKNEIKKIISPILWVISIIGAALGGFFFRNKSGRLEQDKRILERAKSGIDNAEQGIKSVSEGLGESRARTEDILRKSESVKDLIGKYDERSK